MRPMTTEMLKKGYLLFPKALFEEQMNMKTGEKAADAFEAFVFVLTHVNYSTVTCNVRGHLFDCVRGESVLSLARWMEILGWPRNRTRYFFNKMFDAGIVERVANPYVMHIRIPDYDFLTGNARPKAAPRKKKAAPVAGVGEDFCIFWEKFHDITEHPKYNPQIQISAESETKRSIFREKDKTKRSKKESAQHSKSRNKSFVMTSVSAL